MKWALQEAFDLLLSFNRHQHHLLVSGELAPPAPDFKRFDGYQAILTDPHYLSLQAGLQQLIEHDYQKATSEINDAKKNINTILRNVYNWKITSVQAADRLAFLDLAQQNLKDMQDWRDRIYKLIQDRQIGLVYIQTSQFKNDTIQHLDANIAALKHRLMEQVRAILSDNMTQLHAYLPQLQKKPQELLDYPRYMEQVAHYNRYRETMLKDKQRLEPMFTFINRFDARMLKQRDEIALNNFVEGYASMLELYQSAMEYIQSKKDQTIQKYELSIYRQNDLIQDMILELDEPPFLLETPKYSALEEFVQEFPAIAAAFQSKKKALDQILFKENIHVQFAQKMDLANPANRKLDILEKKFNDKWTVVQHLEQFHRQQNRWLKDPLTSIEVSELEAYMLRYQQSNLEIKLS